MISTFATFLEIRKVGLGISTTYISHLLLLLHDKYLRLVMNLNSAWLIKGNVPTLYISSFLTLLDTRINRFTRKSMEFWS